MFNEKQSEFSAKQGKEIPVWQSDKYKESRDKAIEIIKSDKYGIVEADFWILMNETKSGKMAYTGLIISHNGCLKINDKLPKEDKFRPEAVQVDKEGYNASLVFSYCCAEQGLYEVGEVNAKNCRIEYPYAMAYKRLFDRVVLKQSKLAYSGIYSEVEADEFKQNYDDIPEIKQTPKSDAQKEDADKKAMSFVCAECGKVLKPYFNENGKEIGVRQHAIGSEKKFGKVLCLDCIKASHEDN